MQLLIFKFIAMIINVMFVAICMRNITKEHFKINFRLFCIIWITSLMMLAINSFRGDIEIIRPVLALIIYSLMCSLIHRKYIFECIGVTFFLIFMFFLSEIAYSLLLVMFDINFELMRDTETGIILSNLVIGVICYMITSLEKSRERINSIIKILNKNRSIIIVVIIVLLMGILTGRNALFELKLGYIVNFILIIIFLIIMCLLFVERKRKEKLAFEQDILYNYIMKYEKELIQKSKIIHDFKNQLLTIKGFVNETNNANEYLSELIEDIKKFDTTGLKDLNKIPIGGLKGLLYYKFADIEESGIKLSLNVSKNLSSIEKMDVSTYKNLVKIIGVYLDNAIEAATKSKEKKVEIEIYQKNKTLHFIVSNTYSNEINISKLGNPGYSSKGKNRGYGLAFVKDILNQNKNFSENINVSNNIYSVFLTSKIK